VFLIKTNKIHHSWREALGWKCQKAVFKKGPRQKLSSFALGTSFSRRHESPLANLPTEVDFMSGQNFWKILALEKVTF
jgi:hypothetical protein